MIVITIVVTALVLIYIYLNALSYYIHKTRMHDNFDHRIHVNGIRGKSSVTRLVSATLREGGVKTIGKSTGSAARIIVSHDEDLVIERVEADIAEQKRTLKKYMGKGVRAVVVECMAINPVYQKYLENRVMFSTIGVITNVREDHMDLLGKTLPEIARSLSNTIPTGGGDLITAESDPEILAIFEQECEKRGATLHTVKNIRVSDKDMAGFSHFEHKPNVAIALKVAQLVGVSRKKALAGMHKALPDPGAFALKTLKEGRKKIHWANLFAINDRESFIITAEALCKKVGPKAKKTIILNNRKDRPDRVAQFVDIAVNSLAIDTIVTFGDYEKQVTKEIQRHGKTKKVKVLNLGNSTEYAKCDGGQLFEKIVESSRGTETILFGAVNIHTPQAVALLEKLEGGSGHGH